MVSLLASANTIEIKTILPNERIEKFSNSQIEVDDIRTCYEYNRVTSTSPFGIQYVTISYVCFQHSGMLGNSTVYIDAPQP